MGKNSSGRVVSENEEENLGSVRADLQKAMAADQKIYEFMYERIPVKIRNMEVLEIATGPGLLAKHVAPEAKRMVATDYSDGMIAEAKKRRLPCQSDL